jgi:hypothetical protein
MSRELETTYLLSSEKAANKTLLIWPLRVYSAALIIAS